MATDLPKTLGGDRSLWSGSTGRRPFRVVTLADPP